MQKENTSFESLEAITNSFVAPSPPFSREHQSLADFNGSTSSEAFHFSFLQSYSPTSISDVTSFDGGGDADSRFRESRCILEYQQLYNRHTTCVAQLHDKIEETNALRHENDLLRLANADLSRRVARIFSQDRLFSEFSRLNLASPPVAAPPPRPISPQGTAMITEHNQLDERNIARVSLPKSISVRSKGYLKMTRSNRDMTRQKSQHKVYVPGAKSEEEALELDVYNQGTLKTELCNKWEENGACPYGDNCQFAHGITELRPVIRHPRYKTAACRIVLAGEICPYGHRCHFRHSLTEQERHTVMAAPPPR